MSVTRYRPGIRAPFLYLSLRRVFSAAFFAVLIACGWGLTLSRCQAQTTLVNGTRTSGSVAVAGQTNLWAIPATAGESIVVRAGESANTSFVPWLVLYGPGGVLLDQEFGAVAAEVATRATNTGTYLVAVSDGSGTRKLTGDYTISLAKTGSPLSISAGDEGGIPEVGSTYTGVIETGDLDAWTFNAAVGENIVARVGEMSANSSLVPWLRLYDPSGALLSSSFGAIAAEVAARATNSGTFLVVVGDGNNGLGGVGAYRFTLAKTGSQPVISAGDEGGAMVNGTTYAATIDPGDLDAWTFTASAGENLVVRAGETTANSPLVPWLRLYDPSGALLSSSFGAAAAEVVARATNSGTFLLIAGDGNNGLGGAGGYRLTLAKTGSQPVITAGDEGGALVNGQSYTGTIDTGDLDAWIVSAVRGDSVVVRMGETAVNSSLVPWLRIYDPSGALLDSAFGAAAAEVSVRATNTGTFLVIAGDGNNGLGGGGGYRLTLAQTGSEPSISAQDEGGPMSNGSTYSGTIEVGDMDAWTVSANRGDSLVVRMGETSTSSSLVPWLRVYDPSGALLDSSFGAAAAEVAVQTTNTGLFLVVAADGNNGFGGVGGYRINAARTGVRVEASGGDEGGMLNTSTNYQASIDVGDIDTWTFTACAGEEISVTVTKTSSASTLVPWVRLFGRNGALLKSVFAASAAGFSKFKAPENGTYEIVVSDGNNGLGGTGAYSMTVNGLSDEFRLCTPLISGTKARIGAVGASPGSNFVLLSSGDAQTARTKWAPVFTNRFDQFGVMAFTNQFDIAEPGRFFILQVQ